MSVIDDILKCRPRAKCRSTFGTQRGRSVSIVFCDQDAGHVGPHSGFRKRWDNAGNPVKPSKKAASQ